MSNHNDKRGETLRHLLDGHERKRARDNAQATWIMAVVAALVLITILYNNFPDTTSSVLSQLVAAFSTQQ